MFPSEGLGGPASLKAAETNAQIRDGHNAVRAIKLMCKYCVNRAVPDMAAAIDGTRPLEIIADACGYGWGAVCVQMSEDLLTFNVLMIVGGGFTYAQQKWPPLVAEAYAQLMAKRAQKKHLGGGKTIMWTDHANVTRAANSMNTEDVDAKILRWVAEIMGDGSEIRSLGRRSARLADGISRNCGNRDELLEARTQELFDRQGRVKNFDLVKYLSDCEVQDSLQP